MKKTNKGMAVGIGVLVLGTVGYTVSESNKQKKASIIRFKGEQRSLLDTTSIMISQIPNSRKMCKLHDLHKECELLWSKINPDNHIEARKLMRQYNRKMNYILSSLS